MTVTAILVAILLGIAGLALGFLVRHMVAMKELKERQAKADDIIEKAKKDANEIKYNARKEGKEIAREEKLAAEGEIKNKQQEIVNQERNLAKKEASLEDVFLTLTGKDLRE